MSIGTQKLKHARRARGRHSHTVEPAPACTQACARMCVRAENFKGAHTFQLQQPSPVSQKIVSGRSLGNGSGGSGSHGNGSQQAWLRHSSSLPVLWLSASSSCPSQKTLCRKAWAERGLMRRRGATWGKLSA